jgi:hypothetical protein
MIARSWPRCFRKRAWRDYSALRASPLRGRPAGDRRRCIVARHLPLEAIAEAHEIVERGEVMGNVIVSIP